MEYSSDSLENLIKIFVNSKDVVILFSFRTLEIFLVQLLSKKLTQLEKRKKLGDDKTY